MYAKNIRKAKGEGGGKAKGNAVKLGELHAQQSLRLGLIERKNKRRRRRKKNRERSQTKHQGGRGGIQHPSNSM